MNDLPGRGDVNPFGISMPNPHEREGPDEDEQAYCAICGESVADDLRSGDLWLGARCQRCQDSMEYDRLERESSR